MDIYEIKEEYIDFLRNIDVRVCVPKEEHNVRKYIGIVIKVNNIDYYAPLTHNVFKNRFCCVPIYYKNRGLGSILLNNMIPVDIKNIMVVDRKYNSIDDEKMIKYKLLLNREYEFCKKNIDKIQKKAKHIYDNYYIWKDDHPIKKVCCNFPLLEKKYTEYGVV